jgi:cytidylate kinase
VIIAIDGPAASGKSTVAKLVAKRLGFRYIDTGAMYRAITWQALEQKIDISDEPALTRLAEDAEIKLFCDQNSVYRICVNGRDVTEEIRTPKVNAAVSTVSKVPGVRTALIKKQREFAKTGANLVVEGRDIGTIVFPEADFKIFLTASPQVRAKRRQLELAEKGLEVEISAVEREIISRDQIDSSRSVGPLSRASDAYVLNTTDKSVEQVVEEIIKLVSGD